MLIVDADEFNDNEPTESILIAPDVVVEMLTLPEVALTFVPPVPPWRVADTPEPVLPTVTLEAVVVPTDIATAVRVSTLLINSAGPPVELPANSFIVVLESAPLLRSTNERSPLLSAAELGVVLRT
jgi:hypothetical protein